MKPSLRILQIATAPPGWRAVFNDSLDNERYETRVAAWALVENEDGDTWITSFCGDIDGSVNGPSSDLIGHRYAPEDTDLGSSAETAP